MTPTLITPSTVCVSSHRMWFDTMAVCNICIVVLPAGPEQNLSAEHETPRVQHPTNPGHHTEGNRPQLTQHTQCPQPQSPARCHQDDPFVSARCVQTAAHGRSVMHSTDEMTRVLSAHGANSRGTSVTNRSTVQIKVHVIKGLTVNSNNLMEWGPLIRGNWCQTVVNRLVTCTRVDDMTMRHITCFLPVVAHSWKSSQFSPGTSNFAVCRGCLRLIYASWPVLRFPTGGVRGV